MIHMFRILLLVISVLLYGELNDSLQVSNSRYKYCKLNDNHRSLLLRINSFSPKSSRDYVVQNHINTLTKSLSLLYSLTALSTKASKAIENPTNNNDEQLKGFQTKSGLKYFDIIAGINGTSPKYGQLVSFHYTSYYRPAGNGKLDEIDSSYSAKAPFLYKHGNTRVIRGVDEALHSMNVGGRRRVIIPKALGYTEVGLGPVPSDYFKYVTLS